MVETINTCQTDYPGGFVEVAFVVAAAAAAAFVAFVVVAAFPYPLASGSVASVAAVRYQAASDLVLAVVAPSSVAASGSSGLEEQHPFVVAVAQSYRIHPVAFGSEGSVPS